MTSLLTFIRNLDRHRLHTFINLIGLSLSLMVVILLLAFIVGEKQMNSCFPDADKVYLLVKKDQSALLPQGLLKRLAKEIPGIADATMWNAGESEFGANRVKARFLAVDESFLRMFGIRLVSGSDSSFIRSKKYVLTQHFSSRMSQEDQFQDMIGGVVPNVHLKSGFKYDVLVPRSEWGDRNMSCDSRNSCEYMYAGAIRLQLAADPEKVQAQLNKLLLTYKMCKGPVRLIPIKKAYFESDVTDDYMDHANMSMIRLMMGITLATLLLALLNYINLTTASNLSRRKEVGVKQVLGAGNARLFGQFMSETFLLMLISLLLAFVFVYLAKPFFETMLDKEIHLSVLFGGVLPATLFFGSLVLLGFLTGLIPAWSATRIPPLMMMGKSYTGSKEYLLRNVFTVVQFTVSIVLLFSLISFYKQVDFVKHRSLGFNENQLLRVYLKPSTINASSLKQTLLTNPWITNATLSSGVPGDISGKATFINDSGGVDEVGYIAADTDFIQTFGIKLLLGKNLTGLDPDGYLINETAFKISNTNNLDSCKYVHKACGVVSDFHCKDFHFKLYPIVIRPFGQYETPSSLTIRLKTTDVPATMAFIEKTVKKFNNNEFEYVFYDELFDNMYKKEEKQAAAIRFFTLLALMISCMGLFGLAEFYARSKVKEIGIQRVNGAKVSQILLSFNRNFMAPILVAFVLACPIGWYLMNRWLQNFAYRIELSWWIFALAGLIAFVVALLTVSGLSWRAATRNPVELLRYE